MVSRKAQLICFPENLPLFCGGRLVMQELPRQWDSHCFSGGTLFLVIIQPGP